jgi:hypothetical protein
MRLENANRDGKSKIRAQLRYLTTMGMPFWRDDSYIA